MQRTQHTVRVGRASPGLVPNKAPPAGTNGKGRGNKQETTNSANCAARGRPDQPADLRCLLARLEAAGFTVSHSAHGFLVTRWGWLYAALDRTALRALAARAGVRLD